MSQIYKTTAGGGVIPPSVPEQFTADDGTIGVPVAHDYQILSRDTDENNLNGIQTTVDPNGSKFHYVELTNRATGTVTTVGATSGNVITFTAPGTAGIYQISVYVAAWDNADLLGATYEVYGSIKCDGGMPASLATVGTPLRDADVDTGFSATQVTVSFTGLTITVPVTGLAGKTIKWTGILTYVFGGA